MQACLKGLTDAFSAYIRILFLPEALFTAEKCRQRMGSWACPKGLFLMPFACIVAYFFAVGRYRISYGSSKEGRQYVASTDIEETWCTLEASAASSARTRSQFLNNPIRRNFHRGPHESTGFRNTVCNSCQVGHRHGYASKNRNTQPCVTYHVQALYYDFMKARASFLGLGMFPERYFQKTTKCWLRIWRFQSLY